MRAATSGGGTKARAGCGCLIAVVGIVVPLGFVLVNMAEIRSGSAMEDMHAGLFGAAVRCSPPWAGVSDEAFRHALPRAGLTPTSTPRWCRPWSSYANEKTRHLLRLRREHQVVVAVVWLHEPGHDGRPSCGSSAR